MSRSSTSGDSNIPFSVEHNENRTATVRIPIPRNPKQWKYRVLLQSDVHWDNPSCDWDMLRRHYDEAKELGAGIISVGDWFCAMQGKWDKRADKSKLREEHQDGSYLDRLVTTAADFLEPYWENFISFSEGNHESAIYKNHETNIGERLVAALNDRTGLSRVYGGYTGWVRFLFNYANTNHRFSRIMHYCHGWGGGGPVTKDLIQLHRIMARLGNVDLIAFGHTHDMWKVRDVKLSLDNKGNPKRQEIHAFKCGCYKDEYGTGKGGWPIERGHPPKPLGAWWLEWTFRNKRLYFKTWEAE